MYNVLYTFFFRFSISGLSSVSIISILYIPAISNMGLHRKPNGSLFDRYAIIEKSFLSIFLYQRNRSRFWSISRRAIIRKAFLRSNVTIYLSNLSIINEVVILWFMVGPGRMHWLWLTAFFCLRSHILLKKTTLHFVVSRSGLKIPMWAKKLTVGLDSIKSSTFSTRSIIPASSWSLKTLLYIFNFSGSLRSFS